VPRLDKVFKPNGMPHIEEFGQETARTLEEPLQITSKQILYT
jgi:hypothetical protein